MYTFAPKQKRTPAAGHVHQRKHSERQSMGFVDHRPKAVYQPGENKTGLPDHLKAGVESLSGVDMSDVRVHRNSPKPASLNALAYTRGRDIHVAPGQEKHLPHEAWHAVQQKQGRVQPTLQTAGADINDNAGLEKEADIMGRKALQGRFAARQANSAGQTENNSHSTTVQFMKLNSTNYKQLTRKIIDFARRNNITYPDDWNDIANVENVGRHHIYPGFKKAEPDETRRKEMTVDEIAAFMLDKLPELKPKGLVPEGPEGYETEAIKKEDTIEGLGTYTVMLYKAQKSTHPEMLLWVSHGIQERYGSWETAETKGYSAFLVPTNRNLVRTEVHEALKKQKIVEQFSDKKEKYYMGKRAPAMLIGPHTAEGISEREAGAFANLGIDVAIMMDWKWAEEVDIKYKEKKAKADALLGAEGYPPLVPVLDRFKEKGNYTKVIMHTCRSLYEEKKESKEIPQHMRSEKKGERDIFTFFDNELPGFMEVDPTNLKSIDLSNYWIHWGFTEELVEAVEVGSIPDLEVLKMNDLSITVDQRNRLEMKGVKVDVLVLRR